MKIGPGDALLLVDIQRDFLPGGALAVPHGRRVVAPAQRLAERFAAQGLPVFASRDWHPRNHCSFQAQGGPWPPHGVAGSDGAAFAEDLHLPPSTVTVSKGTSAEREAYSAFEGTNLADSLRAAGVRRLFVCGLATDYCVLQSVLDARVQGLDVVVLRDAIAAVNLHAGDGERAIECMRSHGASLSDSAALSA